MTVWSVPVIDWGLCPEGSDPEVIEHSIISIGQLFSWPAMKALVRLNPHAKTDRLYFASTSILGIVSQVDSQEKWEKRVKDFDTRFPNWIVCFWTDCSTIAGILENLNQLRLLWDNQLITSEAFRYIFAEMSENWKTNHRELTIDDGEKLDFWELEMMWMIREWIAVKSFSDELNERLLGLLNDSKAIESII